jgi:hypothetical protein
VASQMSMEDAAAGIRNLVERARGHNINVVCQIYRVISAASEVDRPRLLRAAAEQFGVAESSEEEDVPLLIHPSQLPDFAAKYGDVADAMLEGLIRQNPDEDSFYGQLWAVVNNSFFPDDNAKGFALLHILIDSKIPYFKVENGLRMTDDEFHARFANLQESVAKLRFLMAREFDQKTEKASLILRHIEGHTDAVDRAVLIAAVLGYYEQLVEE